MRVPSALVVGMVLSLFLSLCPEIKVVDAKVNINIVEGTPVTHRPGRRSTKYNSDGYQAPTVVEKTSKSCQEGQVLKVSFQAGASGDGRLYANVYSGGVLQIEDGDIFEYELMWRDHDCNCSIDLEAGSEVRLRDHGPLDALGYSPHAEYNYNMSHVVTGQWYHRSWDLSAFSGKYLDKFVFAAAVGATKTRDAFFRYIKITGRDGSTRRSIFEDGSEPPTASTFMSGGVTTACQSTTVFSGVFRLHSRFIGVVPSQAEQLCAPDSPATCQAASEEDEEQKDLMSNEEKVDTPEKTEGSESRMTITQFGQNKWIANNLVLGGRGLLSGELSVATLTDGDSNFIFDWGFSPSRTAKRRDHLQNTKIEESLKGEETSEVDSDVVDIAVSGEEVGTPRSPHYPHSIAARGPRDGELTKRRLVSNGDMMVQSFEVIVRDSSSVGIVYWRVFNRTFMKPSALPLPLWIPFQIPEVSPLTHVLDGATLEVKVNYFVRTEAEDDDEVHEEEDQDQTDRPQSLPQLVTATVFSERVSFVAQDDS